MLQGRQWREVVQPQAVQPSLRLQSKGSPAPLPLTLLLLCPTCARGQVYLGTGTPCPLPVLPLALDTSGQMCQRGGGVFIDFLFLGSA